MPGQEDKPLWSDKFRMPSIQELRAEIPKPMLPVFDAAREGITDLGDIQEVLAWQGVPWRWTLIYRGLGDLHENGTNAPGGRGFAYVIPDPARMQVCVPLTSTQIEALPMKRFKKSVRDGVQQARSVAGIWWPTWDVGSMAALEEIMELTVRKHKLLVGAPVAAEV